MASWDFVQKQILLGDASTGKSSLLVRLTDDRFLQHSEPTIGCEFGAKVVTLLDDAGVDSGKRVKLQIWDTAGQESFRSITRSYYRGAGGALLVFDIASRSSFDACASWLHDLRSWGEDDVCVLLVGNKADLVEGEAEDRDQEQDREGVVDEGPPGGQGDDGDEHDSGPRSRNSVEQPATPSGSGSERPTADALDLGSANDPTSTRRRRRQVTRAEATAWATEHGVAGYVETSAKSGRGVDAAFDALTREVHRRQQASRASVVGSKRSSSSRGAGSGRGPSSSLPKVLRLGSTEGGGGQGATNGCC